MVNILNMVAVGGRTSGRRYPGLQMNQIFRDEELEAIAIFAAAGYSAICFLDYHCSLLHLAVPYVIFRRTSSRACDALYI